MRIDTDDIERARGRKKTGHKHNHQPRGRAIMRALNRVRRRNEQLKHEQRAFNKLVAAYWRNELDGYPKNKNPR